MNIGTFTKSEDGFTGTIRTLTLSTKVKLVPVEKKSEKAPDFRILSGTLEIGAAWKNISRESRPYVSAILDDPSFPAPIYANLFENETGEHTLLWSRKES